MMISSRNKPLKLTLGLIALSCLISISCSRAPEKSKAVKDEIGELENFLSDKMDTSNYDHLTETTSFEQFFAEIPNYNFPISMSCDFKRPAAEVNFEGCERYFPEGGRVIAKLRSNTDFRFIIFDFPCDYSCPTLFSYNSEGGRLDSLDLTPGQCAEDFGMKSRDWFNIDGNIQIELIDTTQYISTHTNEIQVVDSTTVETHKYILNEMGKFDLIFENKVFIP